jgi:DNA-binding response OmpR family regulator
MKKILIIDDDQDLLFGLTALLTNKGYKIKTISEGHNAPDEILNFYPDVILLDLHLKDTDGRLVCRELKSNSKTKNIPILMISSDTDLAKIAADCPADAIMEKPLVLITLYNQLESLIAV